MCQRGSDDTDLMREVVKEYLDADYIEEIPENDLWAINPVWLIEKPDGS